MYPRRTRPAAIQIHRRRPGVSELLFNANLFSFRMRQVLLYAVLYHSRAPGLNNEALLGRYMF